MRVREARPDEAVALTAFMRRQFLAGYAHSADAEDVARFVARTYDPALQARELADPGIVTLVAEEGAAWVGYAQLRAASRPATAIDARAPAEVYRFYVDASRHGTGTSTRLMQDVEQRARDAGADALWLHVWQQAPRAIRFYEKCGFRVGGTSVFMVGEHRTDDWMMWRRLAPTR